MERRYSTAGQAEASICDHDNSTRPMGADPSTPDVDELEDAPSGKKRRSIILIALSALILFVGGYLAYQAYEDHEFEEYKKSLRNIIPLAVEKNGVQSYFYEDEWNAMSAAEQNQYTKLGVVINKDHQPFILALDCVENGRGMTWDQAMSRYSNVMPNTSQGEAIAVQDDAVRYAIGAFGGSDAGYGLWTNKEYDSSNAWYVSMFGGFVYIDKINTYSVRPVVPVAVPAR